MRRGMRCAALNFREFTGEILACSVGFVSLWTVSCGLILSKANRPVIVGYWKNRGKVCFHFDGQSAGLLEKRDVKRVNEK
jgi:hypothetical protein